MQRVPALALASVCLCACNEHVFRYVPDSCEAEQVEVRDIPPDQAADVLLVVDTSASMCEEQDALARNFFDEDCDVTKDAVGSTDLSFANIKDEYKNPTAAQVDELDDRCGFIQILAAYDNEFRVGVITTDVSACDDDRGYSAGIGGAPICGDRIEQDWGRRPQRGCLQAPPGATKKTFDRSDRDVGDRFRATLRELGVFGSPVERGLDAMKIFLDEDAARAPGCEDDLRSFLRPEAKLVVVFLTDEEDCSHEGVPTDDVPDENAGESCAVDGGPPTSTFLPERCYPDKPDSVHASLAPVDGYADFLTRVKPDGDVRVAVIAGAATEGGRLVAAACATGADGLPTTTCRQTYGNSNFDPTCATSDPPCCVADPGTRYVELVDRLGPERAQANSICASAFRDTMIDIARFIAASDYVDLREPPDDPDAVVVVLRRGGVEPALVVPRLADDVACVDGDGWTFSRPNRVQLCGDFIPKPGDDVRVHAREDRGAGDAGCRLDAGR